MPFSIQWIALAFSMPMICSTLLPPEPTDTPEKVDPVRAAGWPVAMPEVRPAPIKGFAEEATYQSSIADRAADLARRAKQTDDPLRRAEFLLGAASLILGHEPEAACTLSLLGVDDGGKHANPVQLRDRFERAEAHLSNAEAALTEVGGPGGESGERSAELGHQLGTLRAFAQALRAYLQPGEGADAAGESRRAASALSTLLEDRDRDVAAAATFWQACLRSREPDPAPALSRLDLALADPNRSLLPHALFGRLVRCRLLAGHGSPAVAVSLLMQMEERCQEWCPIQPEREDALRAIALTRLGVLREWYERLPADSAIEERQWCVDRFNLLAADRFGDDHDTVLRLRPAIPILAPPNSDADLPGTAPAPY